MPEPIQPEYQAYVPSGIVDAIDGNTAKRGAMIALTNLIPSPETNGLFIPRSAAYAYTSFSGFSSPGYVSLQKRIGSYIVGFISTARNPGHDEPFIFDSLTNAFLTVSGITSANVPVSPASSGAWTPPTVDQIGSKIVFTHPGFTGANFFGWLDISGATITSLTGNINSGSNPNVVTSLSVDPSTIGVTIGMAISGLGIQAGTTIVWFNATTMVISLPVVGIGIAVNFTITSGTATSPSWNAGNTNTNPLPSVPICVSNFSDRAYFACKNVEYYTDVLNPLNIANATNSLTLGGNDPINASIGQSFLTTSTGGVLAALVVFKNTEIWQITGDLALQTIAENNIIYGTGTTAPRSVVNRPDGTAFMANDGIRTVLLTGQVSEPNKDLTLPFLNNPTPTRIAAAYNTGIYRISTNWLEGGVLQNSDFFFYVAKNLWTGPHTISYDCVTALGSFFLLSGTLFTGQIYQSNVIPDEGTDFYNELGQNMTFTYQTVLVPEPQQQHGWTITETALFLEFSEQQTIMAQILDQSFNVLGTYSFLTDFLAPSNAANWILAFEDANQAQNITVQSRHQFKITGSLSNHLSLGGLFVHYQFQPRQNTLQPNAYLGQDLDWGSVADPILTVVMDWGSVADTVLATVDFETSGTHPGNP